MIYRYYQSPLFALQDIANEQLHFASPTRFNDPLDRIVMFDRQRDSNGDPIPLVNVEYRGPVTNVGMCCFSKSRDSYRLWSHYADSHRSVCIAFDFDPYFLQEYGIAEARQVQHRGVSIYFKEISYTPIFFELPYWDASDEKQWSLDPDETIQAFTHKIDLWKDENEVRAFIVGPPDQNVSIPSQSIRGIIIGADADPALLRTVFDVIAAHRIPIELGRMELYPEGTGLNYVPILLDELKKGA